MSKEKKPRGNPAFVKGMKPLNPNGRPKGSENKYTTLAREVMSAKAPEIVNKVIEKAMDVDVPPKRNAEGHHTLVSMPSTCPPPGMMDLSIAGLS